MTTAERPHVTSEPTPESDQLAADLLARSDLRMRRQTPPEAARLALARVLASHPPDTSHGRMLVEALRRRTLAERKRHGPRPDDQRAARQLLELGQCPTPAGVRGQLLNTATHRAAEAAREARVLPLVDTLGPTVARTVAGYAQRHGHLPGWWYPKRKLRQHWRRGDGDTLLRCLLAAGWLENGAEPGTLRPGRQAKGLIWP
jgi:hypothetical protein